ncbi:hypothetical protein NQ317_015840 [Molorchus minor]|uniref:Diacylglycerol kinase n=1 Tax=Molorchus minor TaxID=1323400 RepID=A0ABQ9JN34_9CUCU|nr:hypothetical protein NQ317_015840 [Molorchus minor]
MAVFSKILNKHLSPKMWMFGDLCPPFGLTGFIGAVILCYISFYVFKKLSLDSNVPVRDSTRNHSWTSINVTSKMALACIATAVGSVLTPECIKKANLRLQCKLITSNNENHLHHWVICPLGAVCAVCEDECSMEPGLIDFQCCWCQRTVHTECLYKDGEACDFGPYRNMIVPPWCVQVARRKGTIHKHLLLRGVRDPGWDKWTPLVVIANKKSGNSDGALVLSEFRKYLNPVQVIDLSERKPAAALQWCVLLAPKVINVLVGGGDGTIAWVLTTSHKLDLDPEPLLSIIPLGTGNDLSRVLGWGKENPLELHVDTVLKNLQKARTSELDRWKVEIISTRHLGLKLPNKTHFMYNYMSIGVDAQVALNFHKTRDSIFYVYGSRLFNKLLYLCFGTQQVVTSECKNLEQRLDLYLDGKYVRLPELESIVVLNIPSWGAGVNLWGMSGDGTNKLTQSYHDGILEVVGIYSSFHIAQLQVGLSSPLRLGQAKIVEVRLKEKAPVQIDGEPWEQHPGKLKITFVNRCPVLVNQNKM